MSKYFLLTVLAVSSLLAFWSCNSKHASPLQSGRLPSIPVIELTLIRALPVDGVKGFEPSGLTIYRDTLYTVSDDHDGFIYTLTLGDTSAFAQPAISFSATKGFQPLDFEGITVDSSGVFYLVSESGCQILRVGRNGDAEWITPSLKEFGSEKGLFQKRNAYLEGIALVDSTHFVLCAERSPRGLLFIDIKNFPDSSSAFVCDETPFVIESARSPDFADVVWEKGHLYALHRAAEAISLMDIRKDSATEISAWSFRATVTEPHYLYHDTTYGHAEGFCMDDDKVYVILDNNNDHRQAFPADTRPMLFIFQRPRPLARLLRSP